jgi:hypothetical protein
VNELAYAQPRYREKADLRTAMEDLHANFPGPEIDLDRMAREVSATRLDKIATLIRSLTYGEMIEFASAIWGLKPQGDTIGEVDLPGMFHRWSSK